MAINFPDSPNPNDTHTVNGRTWVWNGDYWKLSGSSNRGISLIISDTPPSDPVQGDMWYESDTGRTFTYYSGAWIELGNSASVETFISDADGDTLIHVESSSDNDTISFTTGATPRYEITSSGHFVPQENEAYDLGTSSNRFRDLYLSGSSIDLGGMVISTDGTSLSMTPTGGAPADPVATESYVNTAITNLVGGAPLALDTLNELAAALNDDASYATTITNALALKLDSSSYTAADVLAKLITVDGAGSSLDADTLDGSHASAFAPSVHTHSYAATSHTHSYLPLTGGTVSGTIITNKIQTNSYSISAPRWDNSFYVLQSQHWYGQNSTQTMYLGESGNPIQVRGYLNTDRGFRINNPSSGDGDDYAVGIMNNDWNCWADIFSDAWIGGSNGWGTFWAGSSGALYRRVSSDTNPNEFVFVGSGQKRFTFELNSGGPAFFDGTLTQNAYDYAEYFEWEDGNPDDEDRRGYSVVMVSDGKIRIADETDNPEDIIGAISGTAAILGDAAAFDWQGKWATDEWGTRITEEINQVSWVEYDEQGEETRHSYDEDQIPEGLIVPEDASYHPYKRGVISPEYDPNAEYVPRDRRKEWAVVGLLGKVRVRAESPKNPNWRYMKVVNGKELWLIR